MKFGHTVPQFPKIIMSSILKFWLHHVDLQGPNRNLHTHFRKKETCKKQLTEYEFFIKKGNFYYYLNLAYCFLNFHLFLYSFWIFLYPLFFAHHTPSIFSASLYFCLDLPLYKYLIGGFFFFLPFFLISILPDYLFIDSFLCNFSTYF